MSEIEQLRADTKKALALLAHTIGAAVGAKPMALSLAANAAAVQKAGPVDGFDELVSAMLLPLSSLALKQAPQDPQVQALYQQLRQGPRH